MEGECGGGVSPRTPQCLPLIHTASQCPPGHPVAKFVAQQR